MSETNEEGSSLHVTPDERERFERLSGEGNDSVVSADAPVKRKRARRPAAKAGSAQDATRISEPKQEAC